MNEATSYADPVETFCPLAPRKPEADLRAAAHRDQPEIVELSVAEMDRVGGGMVIYRF